MADEMGLEDGLGGTTTKTTRDFTEVTSENYFERIGDSCCGVVFGVILIVGSIILLVWNEAHTIHTHKALEEGQNAVITPPTITSVDPANEGKLIHVVGPLTTMNTLLDPLFGVTNNGNNDTLKLQRTVEMYQWIESSTTSTTTSTGGTSHKTTTSTYNKGWSSTLIYSSSFKDPTGHQNPTSMPYQSTTLVANPIDIGAFVLSEALVGRVDWYTPITGPFSTANITDPELRNKTKVNGNAGFYIAVNGTSSESNPALGDMRVSFSIVQGETATIVGVQTDDSFSPYIAKNGVSILLLQPGTYSADAIFQKASDENTSMAWLLRFCGFLIMYFGLILVFQPLAVFADVIPCLGDLVGTALACILFPVALFWSLLIIGLSWIAFRPVITFSLLMASAGIGFGYYWFVVRPRMDQNKDADEQENGAADIQYEEEK